MKLKTTTVNIRAAILEQLEKIGCSPYWLAKEQTSVHTITAQRFLYQNKGLDGVRVAESMLGLTGLVVVPAAELEHLRRIARAATLAARGKRTLNYLSRAIERKRP